MKKTMKKIASIGVAAAVAATSMTGAMAADLSELPAPFVKDGVENFEIVVGATAAPSDVVGAIDIAAAFQAKAVTESVVEVPGAGVSTTVEGGFSFSDGADELNFGEQLDTVESRLDDGDLPVLLADGEVVEDDDNEEFEYEQFLYFGNQSVKFDRSNNDWEVPELYVDVDSANEKIVWVYELDFKGEDLNISALGDSETIEMLGKSFTFDPNIGKTEKVTLFGSDTTQFLQYQTPVTVSADGQEYEIELTGANANTETIFISVDGSRESAVKGDTVRINGLDVYVKDVFITELGDQAAADAEIFVGSQEIELAAANAGFSEVEIDSETINGFESSIVGSDNENVEKIRFAFSPSDLDGDLSGFDEVEDLLIGDSVMDPIFGTFEVSFEGSSSDVDSSAKSMFKFSSNNEDVEFTFTNNDGDEITFEPYEYKDSQLTNQFNGTVAEGWVGTDNTNLTEDSIFAVEETSGSETTTSVFEIVSTVNDDGWVARIKDLADGDTDEYRAGDELVDGVTVTQVSDDDVSISAVVNDFYVEGGENYITLPIVGNTSIYVDVVEVDVEETSATTTQLVLAYDTQDTETTVGIVGGIADEDNDFDYALTAYGSYFVGEADEGAYVEGYVPMNEDSEVSYDVLLVPTGAAVVKSGSDGSSITTESVNAFGVGVGKLDSEVSLATSTKNMIVVGGPCANAIAAELMDNPADCTEGFVPGEAMIKLMDNEDQDTVAMLVAGYDAIATRAAAQAVVEMEGLSGEEAVLTSITSASNYQIQ